jgi:curli biogenesis system outer membrane secretion channel CsgG
MFKKTFAIFLILLASACSSKISNFGSYLPQEFPKTSFMPNPETVQGKAPKVVVFELDNGENEVAKQADLGESITVALENVLTQNRLAQLVDRKAAKKLEKEIVLIEMNKTGSYKGPEIAEYAISGSIGNAGFTSKYSSGMVLPTFTGGITRVPPSFKYISDVSGNIKIYELPSMKVIENIEFAGKKTKKEQVKTNNNISIGGIIEFGGQKSEGLKRDDGLVRNAGIEAIDNISFILKNFFAKKGFISEKRVLKNKVIFKISVGRSDGVKAGDRFEVIGKYETFNALTGEDEIESRIIASGKVADRIDLKSSWVLIDDEDSVNLVRLGDLVRFKYERSFLGKSGKFFSRF